MENPILCSPGCKSPVIPINSPEMAEAEEVYEMDLLLKYQNSLDKAVDANDISAVIEAHYQLGIYYENKLNYNSAIENYRDGYSLAIIYGLRNKQKILAWSLGLVLYQTKSYLNCIHYFSENLILCKEFEDYDSETETYLKLMESYSAIDRQPMALLYAERYFQVNYNRKQFLEMEMAMIYVNQIRSYCKLPAKSLEEYKSQYGNENMIDDSIQKDTCMQVEETKQASDFSLMWEKRNNQAEDFYNMKLFNKSSKLHKKNFEFAVKQSIDRKMEAQSLENYGCCLRELQKYDDSYRYFRQFFAVASIIKCQLLQERALYHLANIRTIQYKNYNEKGHGSHQTLPDDILDEIESHNIHRKSLTSIYSHIDRNLIHKANLYFKMGKYEEAKQYYFEYFDIIPNEKDDSKCEILIKIGHTCFFIGNNDLALKYYDDCLKLIYDRMLRIPVLYNTYQIYRYSGNLTNSLEQLHVFEFLCGKLDDKLLLCLSFQSLSDMYSTMGNYKKALEYANYHRISAELAEDIDEINVAKLNIQTLSVRVEDASIEYRPKDNDHESSSDNSSPELEDYSIAWEKRTKEAKSCFVRGEYRKANKLYEINLHIARNILKDIDTEAKTLLNIGLVQKKLSNHFYAISYFQNGLKLAEKLNNIDLKEAFLYHSGKSFMIQARDILNKYSDFNKEAIRQLLYTAIYYLEESLAVLKNSKSPERAEGAIGTIYYLLGDYKSAFPWFQKKLQHLMSKSEFDSEQVQTLRDIASCNVLINDYDIAISSYRRAVQLCEENYLPSELEKIHYDLANAYECRGYTENAFDHYKMYLELCKSSSNLHGQLQAYWNLSHICHKTGQYSLGMEYAGWHLVTSNQLNDLNGKKIATENISNFQKLIEEQRRQNQI